MERVLRLKERRKISRPIRFIGKNPRISWGSDQKKRTRRREKKKKNEIVKQGKKRRTNKKGRVFYGGEVIRQKKLHAMRR